MKNLFIILFCLVLTSVVRGQKITEWRGGTPGRERDWNCSKNWSHGKVPDEFSDVIISDCSSRGNFYPVIKGVIEYNSVRIYVDYDKVFEKTNPKDSMSFVAILDKIR
ncbi:MAG: hypothetical protein J5I59_11780 [Saprospiraceae bacterium]|nr:hypothetical protein [Saprospiraceae bacterium]